jgi:hypothetical protein
MAYDVHITRAEFWAENEGYEISLEEWRRYVAFDIEIEPDPQNSSTDFLFFRHPIGPVPLWWESGQVYAKNPDKLMIQKMIEIAEKLGARVQGDDGELYNDSSEP